MSHALDADWLKWVDAARAVPLSEIVARRKGLGLVRSGCEHYGPCPACGGDDRFSINVRKNKWRCRYCAAQGGDAIDLVQLVDRCDFVRACEWLTGTPSPRGGGRGPTPAELAEIERARLERDAKAVADEARYRKQEVDLVRGWWMKAKPAPGSPVEEYLGLRRCRLPWRACLRFRPEAELFAPRKRGMKPQRVHTGPAMVAAILGPNGKFSALHTTWIDLAAADGKVLVPDPKTGEFVPAKKVRGSARGGRIELVRVDDPWHVVIGEGIETTLSMWCDLVDAGRDLAGVAFWSGYSLGNIGGPHEANVPHPTMKDRGNKPIRVPGPIPAGGGIPIPDSVTRITLLRDGDSDPFVTDCALERASRRWSCPGREIVAAEAPPAMDFNNLRRAWLGDPPFGPGASSSAPCPLEQRP